MRNHLKRSTWPVILAAVGIAAIAAAIAASATRQGHNQGQCRSEHAPSRCCRAPARSRSIPGLDYTTQGSEINWEVYTGLTTYKHANGIASTELQPGLATALPKITNGGKTYTFTLRKGLKFSNGDPVAGERLRLHGRALAHDPVGRRLDLRDPVRRGRGRLCRATRPSRSPASAPTTRPARSSIHLTSAYGPFANVLAFPAFGLVDPKTAPKPFKTQASNPPAGAGPYMVTNISIGKSFDVVPNPNWTADRGHPEGHRLLQEQIDSNVNANALSVLKNSSRDLRLGRHDPARRPAQRPRRPATTSSSTSAVRCTTSS